MEIINDIFISSNSSTENEDFNAEFGLFKTEDFWYVSCFPENNTETKEVQYKIIKDKSVFDE